MIEWLFGQYAEYSPLFIMLELLAVICGVMSVWLARGGRVAAYPVGLISTTIFVYLLWEWRLFGDMLINAYYSVVSIYGWTNWSKNTQNTNTILIEKMDKTEVNIAIVIAVLTFLFVGVIYYFKPLINNGFDMTGVHLSLTHFVWTDWVDMLTTGLFLVAMWLMARRKIEHWLFWIVADTISVPLYFYKGLAFTGVQYIIFTLIAIFAYMNWYKLWKLQH